MPYKTIIFMKAGPHSGYTLDEIFKMKKKEEKYCGYFFWGYSGTLCHPFKLLTFIEESIYKYGKPPMLTMTTTPSKYFSAIGKIKEYSTDGEIYSPLPKRVLLVGCKFAIIGKNFRHVDFSLDLNKYDVFSGKRMGKPLGEFIRYQINKGCGILSSRTTGLRTPLTVKISYAAELISPYCVFLR